MDDPVRERSVGAWRHEPRGRFLKEELKIIEFIV